MRRVLLIEDSEADRALIQASAEHSQVPIEWEHVTYAEEAVSLLEARESAPETLPELILLDLSLPGMSGVDFLRQRRLMRFVRELPVVVLTSSRDPVDSNLCYKCGANAFVSKPSGMVQFSRFIEALNGFWFDTATLPSHA